ncbi:MAG: DNA polymerase III subunit alpha, partial [Muribaculum sp.]|nr:DNA polymerase III subunit alpha [Muribaculum sp.]
LRKAMGKKLIDKMNHLKGKFLEGGQANGHKTDVLEKIWADWEKFASYAFNKSHATCYSWVAYQTAYLKANYPAEYMAAVLSRNLTDITKLTNFMDECKSMHINVKGPDVNESFSAFGVNKKGDIRFGLAAIKGIGANVVNAIIGARDKEGQFQSIYDFVERVDKAALNRRTLEGLALSGAFDCFSEVNREDFFFANNKGETLAELLARYGQNYQNAKGSQENSLFGDFDESLNTAGRPPIKPAPRWNDIERLDRERDLVGMYLSGHPLDPYFVELRYGCSQNLKEFNEEGPVEDRELTLAGLVCDYQIKQGRKGPFGILKIEDYSASAEFALFGQDYIDYGKFGIKGTPIIIRGRYARRFANSDVRFQIASITLLEQQKGKLVSGITLNLDTEQINENLHGVLNDIMKSSTDNRTPLYLRIHDPELNRSIRLSTAVKIPVTRHSLTTLEEMAIDFDIVHS